MLKWSICCHSEALNNSNSPRIQRPDAFFTSNPEQSVEHPPISDLHTVRLPLNLETRFCEINGKRTCKIQLWVTFQIKSRSTFLCILVLYLKAALFFISVIECPTLFRTVRSLCVAGNVVFHVLQIVLPLTIKAHYIVLPMCKHANCDSKGNTLVVINNSIFSKVTNRSNK